MKHPVANVLSSGRSFVNIFRFFFRIFIHQSSSLFNAPDEIQQYWFDSVASCILMKTHPYVNLHLRMAYKHIFFSIQNFCFGAHTRTNTLCVETRRAIENVLFHFNDYWHNLTHTKNPKEKKKWNKNRNYLYSLIVLLIDCAFIFIVIFDWYGKWTFAIRFIIKYSDVVHRWWLLDYLPLYIGYSR